MELRNLGKYVQRGFAAIGVVTVGTAGLTLYNIRRLNEKALAKAQELPANFILDIDFESFDLVEKAGPGWTQIGAQRPQVELRKVVGLLKEAGSDGRVKGVVASIGSNQSFSGLAQVQELRNAVSHFRETAQGRAATIAYADSFGEQGCHGTTPYYLASAFEKVYMQPSGFLSMNGIAATTPFLKRLMERLNVRPLFFRREAYKNVVNQFTHDSYSEEHREATQALLSGFLTQICQGVSTARGLTPKQVRSSIDNAPFTAKEAVELKLIDGAKYRDEAWATLPHAPEKPLKPLPKVSAVRYIRAQEAAKRKAKGKKWMSETVSGLMSEEEEGAAENKTSKPTVAVVTATGPIVSGKRAQGIVQREQNIVSGQLCDHLSKAREDPSVKAVVLRIDTPGGSAVASDSIYREVLRVRESGKPVVVSMGNVSASGGYYISAPATKIVASPGTITGSIGVAFGKFNFEGLLRDIGVDAESVSFGRNATAMLPFTGFTEEQEKMIDRLTEQTYDGFLEKVATGRKLPMEEVRRLAQGRIWSGEAALERGLVDQLGGLEDAIRLAKTEAGFAAEDESSVELKVFPKQRPAFVQLLQRLRGSGPDASFLVGRTYEPHALHLLSVAFGATAWPPGLLLDEAALEAFLVSGGLGSGMKGPQMMAPDIALQRIL